jgi:hypothetical protein
MVSLHAISLQKYAKKKRQQGQFFLKFSFNAVEKNFSGVILG